MSLFIICIQMSNSIASSVTGRTKIKIVFLGGQAVGKSSIIQKYIHNRFDQTANPTVGIDFLAKNITHKAKNYRLQLWDTAGQQRFRSLIPSYLKDAHCALIIFDVTSKNSLEETDMWINLFNENKVGEGFVFLVGNKMDLNQREVSLEEAKEKAERFGVPYMEISAKTGQNIENLFFDLVEAANEKSSNNYVLHALKDQSSKTDETQDRVVDDKGTKQPAVGEEGPKVSENVVLKNEKVGKGEKSKGCC